MKGGVLHEQTRAAGKITVALLCAALAVVSLVATRFNSTPDKPVTLVAGSGADLARRVQAAQRPSRDGVRDAIVPTTVATVPPPPTTEAPVVRPAAVEQPRVVRQQSVATTAKPTTTTAKPKPATTTTRPPAPAKQQPASGSNTNTEEGKASFYRAAYHADDPWICAHKTLPKGTSVTVTAVSSGKSITCRVGDRGPYIEGRVIDLSEHAFSQLAPTSAGVISVRLTW